MEKFISDLLSKMHLELQKISIDTEDILKFAERSYYIAGTHMQMLKDFISSYEFKNNEEEIRFFKITKPLFQKELIYFDELFAIESDKPLGSLKKQKKYYAKWLDNIELFFARNHHIYNYYRTGKFNSDDSYFLRQGTDVRGQHIYTHDLDISFSTPYSIIFSKFQAFEQLREFLLKAVEFELVPVVMEAGKKKINVTWTDSNAALIELLYGIYTKGSVNFGSITIQQLVSAIEGFFNIRLGNVYPVINGFCIRKKGRTPYLHAVIHSLENKFDEKDE